MEVRNASDLVIVSAYGRGHWLALECARKNWKVTLIDLTSAFGSYPAEDWEGPWGFFDTPDLLPSQRTYLVERDQVYPVANGFVAWLKRGPLEMTGPLTSFQRQAFNIASEVSEYLSSVGADESSEEVLKSPRVDRPVWLSALTLRGLKTPEPLSGLERLRSKIKAKPFQEGWLAYFAHALSSNAYAENVDAIDFSTPLPLGSPYGVRHVSAESVEAGFAQLEKAGVRVVRTNDIYDVRVQSGHFESVIVAGGEQVEKAQSFVWTLSSTETAKFHQRISNSIYPNGNLPPLWAWTRFRFQLRAVTSAQSLPLAFTMVENPFLPWSNSNLLCAKRIRGSDKNVALDIWARVPARVIGDGSYFEKLAGECTEILRRRVPLSNAVCEFLPLEADMSKEEMYDLRFPIYDKDDVENLEVVKARNLFMAGPEQWLSLDWNSQMRFQGAVFGALERLRAHWENIQRREEASQ